MAALGGEGVLWSRVDDDPTGDRIVEELAAWRVELQCHPAGGGRRLTALDRPGRCQRRASDRRAVRFAAAAAAVECTRYGGREGVPDRAAVERIMKENG